MASRDVYSRLGDVLRQKELSDTFVGPPFNEAVVHQCVVAYLANQRQGTASTKTRGEVRGSGKKLYRQKGTGRARVGDNRAPGRVHGAIAFGPKPRSYRQHTPKKLRQLGLHSALARKFQDDQCVLVEDFTLDRPRTKDMTQMLSDLKLSGKVLFVLGQPERNVYLSVRNIPGGNACVWNLLNIYDVIWHDYLVITENATAKLEEKFAQPNNDSSTE